MKIFDKEIQQHINILSCIYDKNKNLTPQEKESLDAVIQVSDTLERNGGILILKK